MWYEEIRIGALQHDHQRLRVSGKLGREAAELLEEITRDQVQGRVVEDRGNHPALARDLHTAVVGVPHHWPPDVGDLTREIRISRSLA